MCVCACVWHEAGIAAEEERRRQREKEVPMDPATWRERQEQGVRPEFANAAVSSRAGAAGPAAPRRPTRFMQQHCPELLEQQGGEPEAGRAAAPEAALGGEELQRREELASHGRSQMPAVAEGGGRLVKTVEHYTFADGEDTVSFSLHFDKDYLYIYV